MAVPTVTPRSAQVRILATTATYPLLQDFAATYQRSGVILSLTSTVGNWQTVYRLLVAGEAPFALTAYLPADAHLWAAEVGQDGIAIIVHPGTTIPALTVGDLRLIFQGRITNWSMVGGPDLPVVVVSRETGADTRLVFESLVMDARRTTPGAELALSSQSVVDRVAVEPGAIGYVSMVYVDPRVRVVPLVPGEGLAPVLPTQDTVSQHTYPLRAPILVLGPTPPAEDSFYRDWFAWMQSADGQAVVGQHYGSLHP
jgi:ABC-type phosphate transport system substrate-binding protein